MDFLSKADRLLGCIDFFNVASAPAGSTAKLAEITAATIGKFLPVSKLLLVSLSGSHRA